MATDYAPLFKDGDEITYTASAPVVAGQVVVLTGDWAVAPASGVSSAAVGVALFAAPAGAAVTVSNEGVHLPTATGSIAAGDLVTSAASGRVSTLSGTNYGTVIGQAQAAAVDGAVVPIRFP